MKGYGKHLVASVTVVALFAFCALAMGFAGAPVQEVQGKSYGDAPGAKGVTEAPLPDKVTLAGRNVEVAEADVAVAPAPAADAALTAAARTRDTASAVKGETHEAPQVEVAAPAVPDAPSVQVNPPTGLTAAFMPKTPPYVLLEWNANNPKKGLKGFMVYRSVVGEDGEEQIFVPVGETKKDTYNDSRIEPGLTYRYRVTALSKGGEESEPTEPVEVATYKDVPPMAPEGVLAGTMETGVGIDWSPNTEPYLLGYNVYRRNALGGYDRLTRTPITANNYYDRTGVAGSVYAVAAVNGYGTESPYAEVTAQGVAPVRYDDGDPNSTVEGLWVYEGHPSASGGKIKVAGSKGDRLHFSFTGRQVKMISAKYWTCGAANVYVDGKLVGTVNLYNYDLVFGNVVLNVPGLPYGRHVLTVELLGSGNPEGSFNFVNVDAFDVW